MINRSVLVGRLTKDPELKYTPNGVAVAKFTLAVARQFSNQQGERDTDFINCVVWRKQAENTANYLKKGSLAGVEGRIETRHYDGQDGKRVYVTEVVADSVQFLEPKKDGQQPDGQQSQQNQSYNSNQSNQQQSYDQRQPVGAGSFGNGGQQQGSYSQQPTYQQYGQEPFNNGGFNHNGPLEVSDDDLPF